MKTLRLYQQEAIDAIFKRAAFKRAGQNLPALVVLASGLGKTVIAAKVAHLWRIKHASKILFLVHMNEAIEQALASFAEEFAERNESLAVINGAIHSEAELLFSTFQTMRNRLSQFRRDEFGLIIVDEAHHGQAVTYKDVVTYFCPKFLVGMTATPNRMDDRDIRTVFGNEVYNYGLSEALAEGKWLSPVDYRVMFDNIDIPKLENLIKRVYGGDRKITREMIDNSIFLPERLEEVARVVKKEQRPRKKKTIIFCRSLNHLRLVHSYFPEAKAYHSKLSRRELASRLADFRTGKLRTILVVDKFNEAIDIPDAELLVFLRSTSSEIVWKQQLGRGCRRSTGKSKVVVLDFVVNCKRFFTIQQFVSEVSEAGQKHQLLFRLGLNVKFSERLIELAELLSFLENRFYPSWEEASKATSVLGIKSMEEYRVFYSRDPRLPSDPTYVYADVWDRKGGWPGFLGTERQRPRYTENCYTYYAARSIVRDLGLKSRQAYLDTYSRIPRLPSNPNILYAEVWEKEGGWPGFLGTERQRRRRTVDFYSTFERAAKAARRLGIKTVAEYHRRYNEDPRLPSAPNLIFKSVWNQRGRWSGFLGTD